VKDSLYYSLCSPLPKPSLASTTNSQMEPQPRLYYKLVNGAATHSYLKKKVTVRLFALFKALWQECQTASKGYFIGRRLTGQNQAFLLSLLFTIFSIQQPSMKDHKITC